MSRPKRLCEARTPCRRAYRRAAAPVVAIDVRPNDPDGVKFCHAATREEEAPITTKIAILDDWQDVARSSADWSKLALAPIWCSSLTLLQPEDEAAVALADFDILLTMRERTAFPETLAPSFTQTAHDQRHRRFQCAAGRHGLHS